jgi:hypothetical protein
MMDPAIEAARAALWSRFVSPFSTILDYVGADGQPPLPTPEECRLSKPNGMSWGCPNENGAMFGGSYLEATLNRWRLTGSAEDRLKAQQIASGLMKLASVGERPGFVARGLAEDGVSHHAIGSNDQTSPWLYGMWRYIRSNVPDEAERGAATAKIIEVAEAIERADWQTPCDREPFDVRSSFARWHFEGAPRLLFLQKMMAELTGEARWDEYYRAALSERSRDGSHSRLDLCAGGMVFEAEQGLRHSWTAAGSVAPLRGLWELEDDADLKAAYARGLRLSAELAAQSLPLAEQYDNDNQHVFSADWRIANEIWREQHSVAEAVEVANAQLRKLGAANPRYGYEAGFVREPLYAAWIVTLCPDTDFVAQQVPAIMRAICHYQYDRLRYSQFFPAELAYYRLCLAGMCDQ